MKTFVIGSGGMVGRTAWGRAIQSGAERAHSMTLARLSTMFLVIGAFCMCMARGAERRLNNLVTEVANLSGQSANSLKVLKYKQPADGWVYFSASGAAREGGRIFIGIDEDAEERLGIVLNEKNTNGERQAFLSAGEHSLRCEQAGHTRVDSVVLRRVPEISFSKFGVTPRTLSAGDYDWDFYAKYLFPHINTVVGMESAEQLSYVRQWKSRGGRWFVESPRTKEPEELLNRFSMRSPFVDGVFVDEFQPETPGVDDWVKKLDGLTNHEKEVRLYFGDSHGKGAAFVKKHLSGRKIVWENYIPEFPEPTNDAPHLNEELAVFIRELRQEYPGIMTNLTLALGFFSAPPLTLNRVADVDFKVWMDRQFWLVASDPAFAGLQGIMEYQTRYADEETVRWAGLLFRHYAIEGQTNLLSAEYGFKLRLQHLVNPDFLEGTKGWAVQPANAKAKLEDVPKLSWYEGRFPFTKTWDKGLAVTAAEGPVELKQTVRDLTAGRLYSVKLMSARKEDIENGKSEAAYHPVELTVDGATVLRGAGSRDLIACPPSGKRDAFTGENPLWVDYRQIIFHADAATAELKINVAKNAETYVLNFVEVQPYLAR